MITLRAPSAFYRARSGWSPVTWHAHPDVLPDRDADLVAIHPPAAMPLPSVPRAQLEAILFWWHAKTQENPEWAPERGPTPAWNHVVGIIADAGGISYAQACAVARFLGYAPAPHSLPSLLAAA
jgi:hypothetical protein